MFAKSFVPGAHLWRFMSACTVSGQAISVKLGRTILWWCEDAEYIRDNRLSGGSIMIYRQSVLVLISNKSDEDWKLCELELCLWGAHFDRYGIIRHISNTAFLIQVMNQDAAIHIGRVISSYFSPPVPFQRHSDAAKMSQIYYKNMHFYSST